MAKIIDFYVEFGERWSVYAPADLLTGVVHLVFDDKVICDQVVAQFSGSARTFWIEREIQPPAGLVNQAFSSEKVFFDERVVLWGNEETPSAPARSLDDIVRSSRGLKLGNILKPSEKAALPHLPAGRHEFPFEFRLPAGLPTSFDAAHADGYVRYFVKAMICESGQSKHSRKGLFTVVQPVDLNELRSAREPSLRNVSVPLRTCSSICCLGARGDGRVVSALLKLRQSGVVPGERVKMAVVVDNGSTSAAVVRARLVQTVDCHAAEPECRRRRSSKTLAAVASEQVDAGGSLVWQPQLFVPAVSPSFALHGLVECAYSVAADVCLGADEPALLTVSAPVVVGTVPLRPAADADGPHNGQVSPRADNIPPQTFEASSDAADISFAPRYAVYELQCAFVESVVGESDTLRLCGSE